MLLLKKVRLNPLLVRLGMTARRLGLDAYLVGGAVRDLLVGKKDLDWDIVTVGSPEPLVKAAARLLKGRVTSYPRFGTYCLQTPKGLSLDFATARKEIYAHPGALPAVTFSGLEEDIYRRDFTVNALAVLLNGKKTGEIVDLFGGKRDLKNGILRVLHPGSFKDDPTRIFRLARFASRGFRIDKLTEKLAVAGSRYTARVSPERIAAELFLIMEDVNPGGALVLLEKWGIMRRVFAGVELGPVLPELSKAAGLPGRFAALFSKSAERERKRFYAALRFPNKLQSAVEKLLEPKKAKPALNGKDLIGMGYKQGPRIGAILKSLAESGILSRSRAKKYVFDNFPQKI